MNKNTGHRVVWVKQGVAEVQKFDVPSVADDEVLIKTRVSLISPGTERAFFLGQPNTNCVFPTLQPGYSNVGEIVEIGSKVAELKLGQRVACSAGHASHVVIEAIHCLPIADAVPDEEAVFFNLITIALQGMRKARIELGESVLVIGAGMIGLFAMQLAKLQGALPAICVDKDPSRASFAGKLGADFTFPVDDALKKGIEDACGPNGPAVVIEATGSPHAIILAFQSARRFGRVILLGSTRGETEKVNFYRDVHQKGLTIVGAHNSTRPQRDSGPGWWSMQDDWHLSLKLLERRRLTITPLITHRFPCQDAAQAYDLLAKAEPSAQGMILDWN